MCIQVNVFRTILNIYIYLPYHIVYIYIYLPYHIIYISAVSYFIYICRITLYIYIYICRIILYIYICRIILYIYLPYHIVYISAVSYCIYISAVSYCIYISAVSYCIYICRIILDQNMINGSRYAWTNSLKTWLQSTLYYAFFSLTIANARQIFLNIYNVEFVNICHVIVALTIFSAQSFRGFTSYNMLINEKSYRCVCHTNIWLGNSVRRSCSILERSTAVVTANTSVSTTGSLIQQATVL